MKYRILEVIIKTEDGKRHTRYYPQVKKIFWLPLKEYNDFWTPRWQWQGWHSKEDLEKWIQQEFLAKTEIGRTVSKIYDIKEEP